MRAIISWIITHKSEKSEKGEIVTNYISTSGSLIRELQKLGDDFITVTIENREYIIDSIIYQKNYTDSPLTHLSLKCRDGGQGEIKR